MAGADYDHVIFRNGVHQPDAEELGSGEVRVRIHKYEPSLMLRGVEVVLESDHENRRFWSDEGYHFQSRLDPDSDMELVEPDGTIWQARAGFQFGERFGWDCACTSWADWYTHHIATDFAWTRQGDL